MRRGVIQTLNIKAGVCLDRALIVPRDVLGINGVIDNEAFIN